MVVVLAAAQRVEDQGSAVVDEVGERDNAYTQREAIAEGLGLGQATLDG